MKGIEVGGVYQSNNCGEFVVTAIKGHLDICVRFIKTGYECVVAAGAVRRGKIKDRLCPVVYGRGFIGEGRYVTQERTSEGVVLTKSYRVWARMLERCYYQKSLKARPTYIGCEVCEEWLNFQTFAAWHEQNYVEGYQLDKDILSGCARGKLYSPATCCFVSSQQNIEHSRARHYQLTNPEGEVVRVFNLSKFARENGLNRGHLCDVSHGHRRYHKGWTAA